jgi:hypothetical protein
VPKDAYWGLGSGHQILLVIPSLNLIMVRNGADMGGNGARDRNVVNTLLFEPLVAASSRE